MDLGFLLCKTEKECSRKGSRKDSCETEGKSFVFYQIKSTSDRMGCLAMDQVGYMDGVVDPDELKESMGQVRPYKGL